jgi:hypothetical protein
VQPLAGEEVGRFVVGPLVGGQGMEEGMEVKLPHNGHFFAGLFRGDIALSLICISEQEDLLVICE